MSTATGDLLPPPKMIALQFVAATLTLQTTFLSTLFRTNVL
jgi:hypothetical protein